MLIERLLRNELLDGYNKYIQALNHSFTQSPSAVSSSFDDVCAFCFQATRAKNEEEMDKHYYNDCLMLVLCAKCSQVVEIKELNEHLLVRRF